MRRPGDTSEDPADQTDRPGPEDSDLASEDSECRVDREVRVDLQGSELWKRFYEIGTEMIITKAGRYKVWIFFFKKGQNLQGSGAVIVAV